MQTKREYLWAVGVLLIGTFSSEKERERETQIKLILYICTYKSSVRPCSDLRVMESPTQYIFALALDLQRRDKYWINNFTRKKFTLHLTKLYSKLSHSQSRIKFKINNNAQKYHNMNN